MTRQQLMNGKTFVFATPDDRDDYREAEVFYSAHIQKFCIYFNGALIHATKTFPPLVRRLEKLSKDWELTQIKPEVTPLGEQKQNTPLF